MKPNKIFTDRQNEIKRFKKIFKEIERKRKGKIVFVFGESGIGKTALINHVILEANKRNFITLAGRCTSEYADSYLPIKDALRNYFGIKTGSTAKKVKNILQESAPELLAIIPTIGSLLAAGYKLAISTKTEFQNHYQANKIEEATTQHQIFQQISLVVTNLSKKSPVLIFIDDLQWADMGTLNILKHLSFNNLDNPLLIIVAYRIEDLTTEGKQFLQELKSNLVNEGYEEIELKSLDEIDSKILIKRLLKRSQIPNSIHKVIYKKTDGHPLFINQVIKDWVESKKLIREKAAWKLISPIQSMEVPKSVKELIKRRIFRLDKISINLLECASVEGEFFNADVIGHISKIPYGDVLSYLSDMERTYNLVSDKETYYEFHHRMIQETLYDDIPPQLKEYLHKQIAEYIEINRDHFDVAEKLAYHYSMCRSFEKAINYNLIAGDKSAWYGSHNDALRYYENALNFITRLNDKKNAERWKIKILVPYIRSKYLVGDMEKSINLGLELLAIHEKLNEVDVNKGEVYNLLGVVYRSKGDVKEALRYFEKAIRYGDNFVKSKAYGNLGAVYMMIGDMDKALMYPLKSIAMAEKIGEESSDHKWLWSWAWDHIFLGKVYLKQNDFTNSQFHLNKAFDLFEKIQNNHGLVESYETLGYLHICMGKYEVAFNYLNKSMDLNKKIGVIYNLANCNNYLGQVHLGQGNYDEALKHFGEALSLDIRLDRKQFILMDYIFIGDVHFEKGQNDIALENYLLALNYAKENDFHNEVPRCIERITKILKKYGSMKEITKIQKKIGKKYIEIFEDFSFK